MSRRNLYVLIATLFALLTVGVYLAYAAGQASADHERILRAHRYEVVDHAGKLRASLASEKDGSTRLALLDSQGHSQVVAEQLPDGRAQLYLADPKGKRRILLAVAPDGQPRIALADTDGTERIIFTTETKGPASLKLCDAAGKPRSLLSAAADGATELSLQDPQGVPGVTMRSDANNHSSLKFFDHGQVIWQAPKNAPEEQTK